MIVIRAQLNIFGFREHAKSHSVYYTSGFFYYKPGCLFEFNTLIRFEKLKTRVAMCTILHVSDSSSTGNNVCLWIHFPYV